MLMEVNQGNAEMIKGFSAANTEYPVSNSLMYSIYKMLPNDTDLTVFREQGNIPGFNFAFIDNHFNYHTEQDIVSNLSPKTLKHQGTYLMPLLNYFSNANLNTLNSKEDYVYFNIPFYFVIYPFKWIIPMLLLTIIAFLIILSVGIGKRVLTFHEIGKGFIPLFASLITAGLVAFLSWKGLQIFYPQYKDILQGFTYNGHAYIGAFVFLSLSIGFFFYRKSSTKGLTQNHFIAPLILWIIINSLLAFLLPGAGFLIIPLIFGVLMFAYFVITQTLNRTINLILSIPALIILVPFIVMFPVGLGLKILVGSAILTILIFGLLLPVFGTFPKKGNVSLIMLLISIGFFVNAHINSDYEKGKAKPNSLLYILNADKNTAIWATYDTNLDNWTKKYLGQNPKKARLINSHPLFSKYNSGFTFTAFAPMKELSKPTIEFVKDTIIGTKRYLKIKITPNRKVNRYDIFANEKMVFYNFNANGATSLNQKGNIFERKGKKVISYYVVDNEPLEMQFSISKNTILDMDLMESSFDLVTNPKFNIIKRTDRMMPMPFVLTDAVIIQQKIKQSPKTETPVVVYQLNQKSSFINDTLTSTNESN